ncbi:MAG: DNA-3-methyladenine glycosylase I [Chitinophagaceae bacterium]|nr:MAG: DNA-3-methyladenine glycosylase I [Chitinophagaceae bacterium]
MKSDSKITRCSWPAEDALMIKYHDEEWGTPVHDDNKLFEFLVLDAFQAGLSWRTILYKRENFRKAFDDFNPDKIAKYSDKKIEKLMNDAGIIRNKLKINGTVENAKQFLKVQKAFGSFDQYIWQFTNHKTKVNKRKPGDPPLATSPESDAMSADLRKRGFKFVGSTICYAFMQASGMINDHVITCFRYKECSMIG